MKANLSVLIVISLIVVNALFFESCNKENESPVASFTVTPGSGNTSTVFIFDASASTDAEDAAELLQVRWDFDGDGVWDTDWLTVKIYNIQYLAASTYEAKLEVKDTEGLTASASQTVEVSNSGGSAGSFTDTRDGQSYGTVEIGTQTWLSENLNFETTDSWWLDNDPANGEKYGRLYTWDAAMAACPQGWHLPTDEEWKQMEMFLGMSQTEADNTGYRGTDEGSKLKAVSGWEENGNGTNSSGFSALPAGFRYVDGSFNIPGYVAWWWTAAEFSSSSVWTRSLGYSYDQIERDEDPKAAGLSVRCVKD